MSTSVGRDKDSTLGVKNGGGDFVESADFDTLGTWNIVPSFDERIPLENVKVAIFVLIAIKSPDTGINT